MSRGRHRLTHPRRRAWPRRPLRSGAVALGAVGVAVLSTAWTTAAADAPSKYGWWSQANAGAPVAAPAPPDVPDKGLYVANGFAGPTAISALSFTVPTGATVGNLTLVATGNPVMTTAPQACALTSAGTGYQSAQNGDWSAAPAYDCSAGKVDGSIGSDGKTVTFAVGPLVKNGSLDLAIIPTGQADRIPFEPPTDSALAVTASSSSGSTAAAGGGGGGIFGSAGGSSGSGAQASGGSGAAPALPPPPPSGATTGTAPDAGLAPAVASPQSSAPAGTSLAGAQPAAASSGPAGRHTAATVIGLLAVVAALLFWSEGFGLLGGRTASLAAPRRRVVPYPDEGVAPLTSPQSAAAHS